MLVEVDRLPLDLISAEETTQQIELILQQEQKRREDIQAAQEKIEQAIQQKHPEAWLSLFVPLTLEHDGEIPKMVSVSLVQTSQGMSIDIDFPQSHERIRFNSMEAFAFTYTIKNGDMVPVAQRVIAEHDMKDLTAIADQLAST